MEMVLVGNDGGMLTMEVGEVEVVLAAAVRDRFTLRILALLIWARASCCFLLLVFFF